MEGEEDRGQVDAQGLLARTAESDPFGKLDDELAALRISSDVTLELERRWRAAGYPNLSAYRRDLYAVHCFGLEYVETLRNKRCRDAIGNAGAMPARSRGAAMTVRPIETLTTDEIKLLARDQADNGLPCEHYFEPGSEQAAIFERAHLERHLQLNPQEG